MITKSRARPAKLVLTRPEQVRALSAPLANRIVAAYERLGRATVAQVAETIGEPVESLYYHVRRLAAVGILQAWKRRSTAGPAETIWALPAREVVLDTESRSRPYLAAMARSVRSLLRLAERSYEAALRPNAARRRGAARTLMVQQHFTCLSARDLAELNRRLEDIATFVRERHIGSAARNRAAPWVSLTMVMSPTGRDADDGGDLSE